MLNYIVITPSEVHLRMKKEKITQENFLKVLTSMSNQQVKDFIEAKGKGPKLVQIYYRIK